MISFKDYLTKNNNHKHDSVSDAIGKFFGVGAHNPVNEPTEVEPAVPMTDLTQTVPQNPAVEDEEFDLLSFLATATQAEDEEIRQPNTQEEPSLSDEENPDGNVEDETQDGNNEGDLPQGDGQPNEETGLRRKVSGAHLVYKRPDDDGTFTELWIFKVGKGLRDEFEIRRDILAGTDIPPKRTSTEDGTQSYTLWTAGTAQLMQIKGLSQ